MGRFVIIMLVGLLSLSCRQGFDDDKRTIDVKTNFIAKNQATLLEIDAAWVTPDSDVTVELRQKDLATKLSTVNLTPGHITATVKPSEVQAFDLQQPVKVNVISGDTIGGPENRPRLYTDLEINKVLDKAIPTTASVSIASNALSILDNRPPPGITMQLNSFQLVKINGTLHLTQDMSDRANLLASYSIAKETFFSNATVNGKDLLTYLILPYQDGRACGKITNPPTRCLVTLINAIIVTTNKILPSISFDAMFADPFGDKIFFIQDRNPQIVIGVKSDQLITSKIFTTTTTHAVFSDIDKNGIRDLILLGPTYEKNIRAMVYLQDENSQYRRWEDEPKSVFYFGKSGDEIAAATMSDFDGDGIEDIVWIRKEAKTTQINWLAGLADGTFLEAPPMMLSTAVGTAKSLGFLTLNNERYLAILDDSQVSIFSMQ